MNVKGVIRSLPVLGPLSKMILPPKGAAASPKFETSQQYWESRYRMGGNSGAGSYNQLARHKADVVNAFVKRQKIQSVIEFGCGDGAQLALADYPKYVGVDVSPTIVEECRRKFAGEPRYSFLHTSEVAADTRADLSLSLDVIYHLVEDAVFDTYMRSVFDAAGRAVIVYSSNEDRAWKDPHVRHRKFTDWVATNRSDFVLAGHTPNAYPYDPADDENTSFADFYFFAAV